MSGLQEFITHTGNFCLLALFVGLFARKRYTECLTFTVYVSAVVLAELLILLWPRRFHTWDFWVLKEIVHNLLKFAIALELAVRTFRVFPGASATARRVLLVVVVATGGTALAVSTGTPDYPRLAGEIHGRVLNGTMWLFTAVAAVILWYRLPVNSFHKAILLGFVPYLLIFAVAMKLFEHFGWDARDLVFQLHTAAYVVLLLYWTRVVWSPQAASVRAPAGHPLPPLEQPGSERSRP